MTDTERDNRIMQAYMETLDLLLKATDKYHRSVIYLKMEIADNKEFGNDDTANNTAREHTAKCKARCSELERHIERLATMLN
jgi:hypothetical protein